MRRSTMGLWSLIFILLLFLTKSMYITFWEYTVIYVMSVFYSNVLRGWLVRKEKQGIPMKGALAAFIFFWMFAIMDLFGDHMLYFMKAEPALVERLQTTSGELLGLSTLALIISCLFF